jgi:hypothetical protein
MKKLCTPLLLVLFLLVPTLRATADAPAQPIPSNAVLESFDIAKHGDAILVPVAVADKQYWFLLDTGAAGSAIDTRLLTGTAVRKIAISTPGGTTKVGLFRAPPLAVGSLPFLPKEKLVLGLDLTKIREVSGLEIYGVLGMDFLRNHICHINFDEGKLLFLKSLPANRGQAFALGLSADSNPTLTMQIGGWGRREFMIDTGWVSTDSVDLPTTTFNILKVLGRLHVFQQAYNECAAGTRTTRLASGPAVALGNFKIAHPIFTESVDGNRISLGVLSRFVATFDFPKHTLYLMPGQAYDRTDTADVSGLSLLRRGGMTVVYCTKKASVADKLGIKAGDIITMFGDKPAAEKSLFEIRRQLCEAGQTIPLTIQRDGETLQVALMLKKN